MHKFERAGLGKAPFRVVGNTRETYVACPGAPVQPGACCDYCMTGIIDTYWIRSADGKRFKVGSTCVYKTKDAKLVSVVEAHVRKAQREQRHAREAKKVDEAREMLAREDVQAKLAAQPHPWSMHADQGATLLDWATWMMENSGNTGKIKVLKTLKNIG